MYGNTVLLGWVNWDGIPIVEGFDKSDKIGEVCLRLDDKAYWCAVQPNGLDVRQQKCCCCPCSLPILNGIAGVYQKAQTYPLIS